MRHGIQLPGQRSWLLALVVLLSYASIGEAATAQEREEVVFAIDYEPAFPGRAVYVCSATRQSSVRAISPRRYGSRRRTK
jgi:hypothetical protein